MRLPNQRSLARPKRIDQPAIWQLLCVFSLSLIFLGGCASGTSGTSGFSNFFSGASPTPSPAAEPTAAAAATPIASPAAAETPGRGWQENGKAGARCFGERGDRLERRCERICRSSAGVEAGGECGESDRRNRPDQRRRKPGEQFGDDGTGRFRRRDQEWSNADVKCVADNVGTRSIGTNDPGDELARAGSNGDVRRIRS